MFWRLFNRRISDVNAMMDSHFIEVKAFYMTRFDEVPAVSFIGEIDLTQAFSYINGRFRLQIVDVYQHSYFDHEEQRMLFNNTVFILNDNKMIELAGNYCQVLHTPHQYGWATELITALSAFRATRVEVAAATTTTVIGFARQPEMN